MMVDHRTLSWPRASLGRALCELSRALRLETTASSIADLSPDPDLGEDELREWLALAASHAGLCLDETDCALDDLDQTLRRLGPALLQLEGPPDSRHLLLLASTAQTSIVLDPSGRRAAVPHRALVSWLTRGLAAGTAEPIEFWLSTSRVPARRRRRAQRELQRLLLSERRVRGLYLVRQDPGAPARAQLSHHGFIARGAAVAALCTTQVALSLASWVALGNGALGGHVEIGWLMAWCLAQATGVWLQVAVYWSGGALSRDAAVLIKRRLLCGAQRIDADEIRTRGSGRLLAVVFESDALEAAGLAGVFGMAIALLQLLGGAVLLASGTNGVAQLLLLLLWCGFVTGLLARHFRQRGAWTLGRFALARSFVENVVGNRTRVAQQPRVRWHTREDRELEMHVERSTEMDASQACLLVLPARGFLLLGLMSLVPALLGAAGGSAKLGLTLLGLLQVYGALGALCAGAVSFGGALSAWTHIRDLFYAAARPGSPGLADVALARRRPPAHRRPILEARGLSFRYPREHVDVLDGCELTLRAGDRILCEGPSGAGKSTLAALMVGLRDPSTGHILSSGLDRGTLGAVAWRRIVTSAPQFHENHIFSGSLAFNLLMGRAWPAEPADLRDARELCEALGLGELLARMPSGLNQAIGETGWQLSHGERSRIFLARAMLQDPDVLVLDESFGALDAESLDKCLTTLLSRARTLVVIAHP